MFFPIPIWVYESTPVEKTFLWHEPYIIILIIFLISGLIGAGYNYFRKQLYPEHTGFKRFFRSLLVSIIAAFAVPLFLLVSQSAYIDVDNLSKPIYQLALLGFGLIAAVSGNAFISTVSSSAITDMKDENKKVKDDLKEVKQKFVPHEYLGVELDRNDADSWPKDAMEYINPCDDEINILKSIAYKCYTLRTFKGIAVAIGYYDNDVLSESKIKTLKCHLETLTDLKYLSLHECRDLDGIPRYSITKFGIKFLSEYEHGHAKDVATYYEQHKYLL